MRRCTPWSGLGWMANSENISALCLRPEHLNIATSLCSNLPFQITLVMLIFGKNIHLLHKDKNSTYYASTIFHANYLNTHKFSANKILFFWSRY